MSNACKGSKNSESNINISRIALIIDETIKNWHEDESNISPDRVVVTEDIRRIRPIGEHRDDLYDAVKDLTLANIEMWHEEDKMRSENDQVVVKAARNINALNQRRNDLVEEVDEIVSDFYSKRQ